MWIPRQGSPGRKPGPISAATSGGYQGGAWSLTCRVSRLNWRRPRSVSSARSAKVTHQAASMPVQPCTLRWIAMWRATSASDSIAVASGSPRAARQASVKGIVARATWMKWQRSATGCRSPSNEGQTPRLASGSPIAATRRWTSRSRHHQLSSPGWGRVASTSAASASGTPRRASRSAATASVSGSGASSGGGGPTASSSASHKWANVPGRIPRRSATCSAPGPSEALTGPGPLRPPARPSTGPASARRAGGSSPPWGEAALGWRPRHLGRGAQPREVEVLGVLGGRDVLGPQLRLEAEHVVAVLGGDRCDRVVGVDALEARRGEDRDRLGRAVLVGPVEVEPLLGGHHHVVAGGRGGDPALLSPPGHDDRVLGGAGIEDLVPAD